MEGKSKQPPRKKQKMGQGAQLELARLATHPVDFPAKALSPGAVHSCRVAVAALAGEDASAYEVYAASGRQIYRVMAPRSGADAGFHGEQGKGNVFIPVPGTSVAAEPIQAAAQLAEVQDLRLFEHSNGSAVLASADCYGRAVLAHMVRSDTGGAAKGSESSSTSGMYELAELHRLQPTELLREAGWAGVAVAPGQPSQAAVARHFARDVTLFDGPLPVRTIHTLYPPNAVELLSTSLAAGPGGGPLVAVAEGPQISIWDVRGAGRGARVARLGPGPHHGALYALAASDDGSQPLLGAAGVDRGVLVYDPRKWSLLQLWSACLKYEATQLHFSSASPQHCMVGGLDYEVLCGEWSGNKASRLGGPAHSIGGGGAPQAPKGRAAGPAPQPDGDGLGGNASARGITFRGDARWLGLAKARGQDVLAGLTASGQLYTAEFRPAAASAGQ